MDIAAITARVLLALVFAAAGVTKLADRPGLRRALVGFGVPAKLQTPLSIALPLVELAVAAVLVVAGSARWSGLSALVVLLLFMVAVVLNLAHGRRPDCHCFGQLHSRPIGWPTLMIGAALCSLAGFVMWRGDTNNSVILSFGTTDVPALALASVAVAIVAAEGWLMLHLMRQNGRLLVRIEALEALLPSPTPLAGHSGHARGLPVGAVAPAIKLPSLNRSIVTLADLCAAGKPVLLVFSDPSCGPCHALMPDLMQLQREHAATLTVVIISRGTMEINRSKYTQYSLINVLLQQDREIAHAYHVYGTPSAVTILPDGTVGGPLAVGPDAIRALAASLTGTLPAAVPNVLPTALAAGKPAVATAPTQPGGPASRVGQPAPNFTLLDLDGIEVDFKRFRGQDVFLLFWHPDCGFCRQMLNDLKAWERKHHVDAPSLLLVSMGSADSNRRMALMARIVLDETFSVAQQFGVIGTPSAILVDANGKIASELAVGAVAIMDMLRTNDMNSEVAGRVLFLG